MHYFIFKRFRQSKSNDLFSASRSNAFLFLYSVPLNRHPIYRCTMYRQWTRRTCSENNFFSSLFFYEENAFFWFHSSARFFFWGNTEKKEKRKFTKKLQTKMKNWNEYQELWHINARRMFELFSLHFFLDAPNWFLTFTFAFNLNTPPSKISFRQSREKRYIYEIRLSEQRIWDRSFFFLLLLLGSILPMDDTLAFLLKSSYVEFVFFLYELTSYTVWSS